MKKILAIAMILVLALGLCSCGEQGDKKITIGVCQLVQPEALDSATQGFIDTVKAEFGSDVEIINQNASGDVANCATIVNSFVSRNVDLILANATSPLQAAASATNAPIESFTFLPAKII